jgi:hypothetical protein
LGTAFALAGELGGRSIIVAADADILAGGAIAHWPLADLIRFSPQARALWVVPMLASPIRVMAMDAFKRVFMAISLK